MLNDDLISAYLDGELSAAKRIMVEQELRQDPAAAARFQRMAGADAALKSAFGLAPGVDADPLRDLILSGPAQAPSPKLPKAPGHSRSAQRWRWGATAAAMSMALACGMVLGDVFKADPAQPYGISAPQARLLDRLASGESAEM
ncbi:MAG: hypothetical protein ABL897_14500, partial [Hyphomicrobium sp.]